MISIEYTNAYSEILEILKFISSEDYKKIPDDEIEFYQTYANKNYKFQYNPAQTLDEQNVSKKTKAIIGVMFRDYWCTSIQKEKIIAKQENIRRKLEEQKRTKYNPDDIFKSKKIDSDIEILNDIKDNMQIIEYKEQKWYQKIFVRILKVFRKNF